MIVDAFTTMGRATRVISLILLAAGVVLVFAGVNRAVGFSIVGVFTSAATIAALLYSGAVWFGRSPARESGPRDPVIVFDRSLRIASGTMRGRHVASCFPGSMRGEIERGCATALAGTGSRFTCVNGRDRIGFDVVPVRTIDGSVAYGVVMAAAERPVVDVGTV